MRASPKIPEHRMKAIKIVNAGADYSLVIDDIEKPEPRADEVLVEVAAAGVNHADLIQARGAYPPPPGAPDTLGLEVSGTIAALGENVAGFAVGDEVCALLAGGGYAQFVVVSALCVL